MRTLLLVSVATLFVPVVASAACPTPASVSNFMPPAFVPPDVQKGACTNQQISDYYTACLDANSTQMTCTQFTNMNMACANCMTSARTDAKWGATVVGNGIVSVNVSGCADILGNNNCAKAYQAQDACKQAACDMVCPVMDQQSFQQWQQCVQTAAAGGCASYVNASNAACAGDAGGLAMCFNFMTFQNGVLQLGPLFCGGAVAPDGGTEMDSGIITDSGVADSGPKTDAGTKADSGAKDAGDGDDLIVPKGGCRCDASGNGGSGIFALLGVGIFALARARRRRS